MEGWKLKGTPQKENGRVAGRRACGGTSRKPRNPSVFRRPIHSGVQSFEFAMVDFVDDAVQYGAGQPHEPKFKLEWNLLDETAREPPSGQVRYVDKSAPIFERCAEGKMSSDEVAIATPYIFTRGCVDVSQMATYLESEGDELWSEEKAREQNVHIARPSHDAWGIRKLCFVFCDDFLLRRYRLPLWRDAHWRSMLDPIFEACGVPPHRIVRCLLASMPPSTVIPVHHDSGYWVKYTHRLHCAIITHPNVVFRVGATADDLQRFELAAGKVVELNNQAKHFVSNLWNQYRTHLIFDYVDDDAPAELVNIPTVELEVGAHLLQTRRTIDLESEAGTAPRPPHFLILGAQKAGTTSMYDYLSQHPLVIRGKRRETHFLDWRWQPKLRSAEEQRAYWAKFYNEDVHRAHPSLLAGDSTPSYLLASHLAIPRLRQIFGQNPPPMIIMLRDPVKRALSHYAMVTDEKGTEAQLKVRGNEWRGRSIAEVVDEELAALRAAGVTPGEDFDWRAFGREYLPGLPNSHGSHSLLLRGLYALQLRPWIEEVGMDAFCFVRCEDLKTRRGVQMQVNRVAQHIGLRPHPVVDPSAKNTRIYTEPDGDIVRRLREFYAPFNYDLYEMIGWAPEKQW